MAICRTVGELIERLNQCNLNAELDIDVSWYDRNNYNHAHRDIWQHPEHGISLDIIEEDGIVTIFNNDCEDIAVYGD